MSKKDKLIERLKTYPNNFTYSELTRVLNQFGYTEYVKGKTSGSRVAFVKEIEEGKVITKDIFRLHKPHPSNELKAYQVSELVSFLKDRGLI